jgi:hypothetical protein
MEPFKVFTFLALVHDTQDNDFKVVRTDSWKFGAYRWRNSR